MDDLNPDDQIPLPELQQADLGPDQLAAYLHELGQRALDLSILIKAGAREKFSPSRDVIELGALVATRKIWGAQLRYRVDGKTWFDTLLVKSDSVRLVRMEQE